MTWKQFPHFCEKLKLLISLKPRKMVGRLYPYRKFMIPSLLRYLYNGIIQSYEGYDYSIPHLQCLKSFTLEDLLWNSSAFSIQTQRNKPTTKLSLFPWQQFWWAPLFSSIISEFQFRSTVLLQQDENSLKQGKKKVTFRQIFPRTAILWNNLRRGYFPEHYTLTFFKFRLTH